MLRASVRSQPYVNLIMVKTDHILYTDIHEHYVNDLPDNIIMIMPSLIRPVYTSQDDIIMKHMCT